jgi:hypothetical protein
MQVNSAQDYLTAKKRQVIASTYHVNPPPQKRRSNEVFTSAMANGATQRQRFVAPFQGAWGGASGGATYASMCCLNRGATSKAPGALGVVVDSGVVRFNVIPPISVTATRTQLA